MSITQESSDALDRYSLLSLERCNIDLTGPRPRCERGHSYNLTCVDAFTKWAEVFPPHSEEAQPIAKVLVQQVFCRFGSPVSLLSD